ncbi:MAG: acyltransferase [Oscillospiraceae bacterium]|nr:acyltransferase [Oscillospiraceae bacterium]
MEKKWGWGVSTSGKRTAWPDWVKGIGILSIVMAHVTQYFPGGASWLNRILCSYHVPIFFVWGGVSAALWPKQYQVERRDFYLKRVKRFLIPYVLFSLFNSALKLGVLLLTHQLTESAVREELRALLITGNGTVWFLVTLFLIEILFYETKNLTPVRYVTAAIGLVLPFLLQKQLTPLLLLLVRALFGFSYFMIGYLFWQWFAEQEKNIPPKKSLTGGLLLVLAGCVAACRCRFRLEFFSGVFSNGFAAVPISLVFSIGIILIAYSVRERNNRALKLLQYFGKESLLVMLIHPTVLLFFTYPFGRSFATMTGLRSFACAMLTFAAVAALNVPVITCINRWFPILKGEVKKR